MQPLEIEHLDFGYGDGRLILHDINLTIDQPGLYCILGPNGVGKSTLIKCMNRILEPRSGCVKIGGVDIKEMSRKDVASYIGYVPVISSDAFAMSVIDTILIGRYNKRKWGSEKEDLEAVYRALKVMRIRNLAARNYNDLSAGQHQKVSIARGLVQETPVLLLDEPTANLDVKYQVYVTEMLRAYAEKKGVAVLMISHDLNVTAKYAHSVIMLEYPGSLYMVGEPLEVLTEENIRKVYGINCEVDTSRGYPYVILGESILDDDDSISGLDRSDSLSSRVKDLFRRRSRCRRELVASGQVRSNPV